MDGRLPCLIYNGWAVNLPNVGLLKRHFSLQTNHSNLLQQFVFLSVGYYLHGWSKIRNTEPPPTWFLSWLEWNLCRNLNLILDCLEIWQIRKPHIAPKIYYTSIFSLKVCVQDIKYWILILLFVLVAVRKQQFGLSKSVF